MAKRVVIIHGSYGNAQENWFPWLAGQVRALGYQAVVPDFPTPEGQSLPRWLDVFAKAVGELTPEMILVGHSVGVAFILRLLERAKKPVSGCFLVSGFLGALGLPEFDAINADFTAASVDWARVREKSGAVRIYHGDTDPYVPVAKGEEIARHLGVELKVVQNGGHLNTAAGYTTFPALAADLR